MSRVCQPFISFLETNHTETFSCGSHFFDPMKMKKSLIHTDERMGSHSLAVHGYTHTLMPIIKSFHNHLEHHSILSPIKASTTMKVSALLLAQLLQASSTGARLFQNTRTREMSIVSKNEDDTDRIINGVEAEEDRYSHMVSLSDNNGAFVLSILSSNYVASSTSCTHTQMNVQLTTYESRSLLRSITHC